MIQIQIPDKAKYIIETIQAAGFEAYVVGGCVRDSILGRPPEDWDITTSARPEQVKQLFRRTIDTGIQHGTVTVMLDKEGFEVTTYRVDGKYEDSRHPKEVTFTPNLEEDLKRRDFTINAMAYNETEGLIDQVLLPLEGTYETVLVVAHGGVNRSILNPVLNIPVDDFWRVHMGNCATAILDCTDGKLSLLEYTDSQSANTKSRLL